ncbi:MAG TPA: RNA polymerase sigma factor [Pyrinomonadaceae bacterium]|nr:RNA polymerase sigma factor [Pyrinomonadaceae bacterium]
MCCDEDNNTFSFDDLLWLLEHPPFEPCQSELEFLTQAEYDNTFSAVWRRYFRPVRLYIAHIMEDREIAADLTQKVFISLYYAKASFEPAYIYRSAKNAALTEIRRKKRETLALRRYWRGINPNKSKGAEATDPEPLQDAKIIAQRREAALSRAIDMLPEQFRTQLLLLAQGKSYKQITKITEANEGTVKSRICRGKRLLRRRLHAYL